MRLFYRQKILLSLVEGFGGTLGKTDLQKLMFLFCKNNNKNFYDFFPYKYGPFSLMTYVDKNKLVDLELLKNVDHFEIKTQNSFLNQLKKRDKEQLLVFIKSMASIRGTDLVRHTYLSYPSYTQNSEILDSILDKEEIEKIEDVTNHQCKVLFTIGYEGASIDNYLHRLTTNDVKLLIDVRKNAYSRKHGFSGKTLEKYVSRLNIKYIHMPKLGIDSHLRTNLESQEQYKQLFDIYEQTTLIKNKEFLSKIQNLLNEHGRIALTCFEADYCSCHRHKIVNNIELLPNFKAKIQHI